VVTQLRDVMPAEHSPEVAQVDQYRWMVTPQRPEREALTAGFDHLDRREAFGEVGSCIDAGHGADPTATGDG
jgi:hypothetical protein